MRRISRKKKGFTLVEMVLVLAITILIGSVVAGVCLAVSNSFITTYNIDDSSDYAMLYAKGFENSFLTLSQADGAVGGSWKWYIADPAGKSGSIPTLTRQTADGASAAVFNPANMNSASGDTSKWAVAMFYKYDEATACVDYRIFVKDNYSNNEYVNRYDGSFWIPRLEDCARYDGVGGNRTVEIVGDPLNEDTLKSAKYGFTQNEVDQISSALDEDFKDEVVFVWG